MKMYRHTIEHTEHLPDGTSVTFYKQTCWDSVQNYIPGIDKKIVLVEEKEIKIDSARFDRRKKRD